MLLRKKRPVLTRDQSLSAIPVRNQQIEEIRGEDGEVVLRVPRRKSWWVSIVTAVFYVPDSKKVGLDELGSYVWNMLDGHTTVREIIDRFSEKYRLSRKEADVSVVEYLRQLARKGYIGLAVPEDALEGTGVSKAGKKSKKKSER